MGLGEVQGSHHPCRDHEGEEGSILEMEWGNSRCLQAGDWRGGMQ